MRSRVAAKDPAVHAAYQSVLEAGESQLSRGPWMVTNKTRAPPSGDLHDYVSLDKYYWPCNHPPPPPDNFTEPESLSISGALQPTTAPCDEKTGLPYIRHDGQVNPEMKLYDHDALVNMTEAVIDLCVAFYFSNDTRFSDHAANLLGMWFLDNATRMNPNLNFGHFIPGVSNGSHGGMIDTHDWPRMLDAVSLLTLGGDPAAPGAWTVDDHGALMSWFSEYLDWAILSPVAVGEDAETNNHGVWYDVQLLATSLHTGRLALAEQIAANPARQRLAQIDVVNGSLPAEDARTKSWSYNEFCMDAFTRLADLCMHTGVNLWKDEPLYGANRAVPPGVGDPSTERLRLGLEAQLPYILLDTPWPHQQIVPFVGPNCTVTAVDQCRSSYAQVMLRASRAYNSSTFRKAAVAVTNGTVVNSSLALLVGGKLLWMQVASLRVDLPLDH